MIIQEILPFVRDYLDQVNEALKEKQGASAHLTNAQKYWLGFCILGILLTQSVCWARFERVGLGRYSMAALSWMFRHSKLMWDFLLYASTLQVLKHYGLKQGVLVFDDTDKKRSKTTKTIAHVHKRKDKTTGGYFMGQGLVFLLLTTETLTLPVGFRFYEPDPAQKTWKQQDQVLRTKGVAHKDRPKPPEKDPSYPTIPELALELLTEFKRHFPVFHVQAVLADALYGAAAFIDPARKIFGQAQVITQIRRNQVIRFRNKKYTVERYFKMFPGVEQEIAIRGAQTQQACISSARLYVQSHGVKRFIIALKYEGEQEYRYLLASELSWRTLEIINAYSLRWLVEVFIEDWKQHEGWAQLTKHAGHEGSSRVLILSLLCDHCLLFHPLQTARFKHKQPAYTVGSRRSQITMECLLTAVNRIAQADKPVSELEKLAHQLKKVSYLNVSKKHMAGNDLGRLEASPSLKYRAAA